MPYLHVPGLCLLVRKCLPLEELLTRRSVKEVIIDGQVIHLLLVFARSIEQSFLDSVSQLFEEVYFGVVEVLVIED